VYPLETVCAYRSLLSYQSPSAISVVVCLNACLCKQVVSTSSTFTVTQVSLLSKISKKRWLANAPWLEFMVVKDLGFIYDIWKNFGLIFSARATVSILT
jgi:hypothetical protein